MTSQEFTQRVRIAGARPITAPAPRPLCPFCDSLGAVGTWHIPECPRFGAHAA